MAALGSEYYRPQTYGSWYPVASSGSYGAEFQQIRDNRDHAFKAEVARVVARDKRERKAKRDRLVISGMARQQTLRACAAIRERRFRRGKRQLPDWLAQRGRVFRG